MKKELKESYLEVFKKIIKDVGIVEDSKIIETLSLETRLREDLGFDSLDKCEFHFNLESYIKQSIPDEIMAEMETFEDYAVWLNKNLPNNRIESLRENTY